jgi:DNA-binding IscR family transcriptional regulator
MNQQISLAVDADILGDGCLQERFTAYVEVLGHFVRNAPRSLSVAWMAERSGIPVTAAKRTFRALGSAGMLQNLRDGQGMWRLVKKPSDITLEEVFRCAVAANARRRRAASPHAIPVASLDSELLLMQALQAVDDHLYRKLRTYSLDRLMAIDVASFPMKNRHPAALFAEVD